MGAKEPGARVLEAKCPEARYVWGQVAVNGAEAGCFRVWFWPSSPTPLEVIHFFIVTSDEMSAYRSDDIVSSDGMSAYRSSD